MATHLCTIESISDAAGIPPSEARRLIRLLRIRPAARANHIPIYRLADRDRVVHLAASAEKAVRHAR